MGLDRRKKQILSKIQKQERLIEAKKLEVHKAERRLEIAKGSTLSHEAFVLWLGNAVMLTPKHAKKRYEQKRYNNKLVEVTADSFQKEKLQLEYSRNDEESRQTELINKRSELKKLDVQLQQLRAKYEYP